MSATTSASSLSAPRARWNCGDVAEALVEDPDEFGVERVGLRDEVAVGGGVLGTARELLGLGEGLVEVAVGVPGGTGGVLVDRLEECAS